MTPEQSSRISVIDPISPAIQRVKVVLFKPFDLGRWFTIGFCAWLAYLGKGGGGGGGGGRIPTKQDHAGFQHAKDFIIDNLHWFIPAAIIGVMLMIVIWLVITWLSSRGKFMFLHCVATNKSEVKVPWHKFRKHANSLFLFRIVLCIISLFAVAVPVLGIVFFIIMMVTGTVPGVASIPGIIIFGLITLALSVTLFLVKKFTFDFVVPIMFLRMASCIAGWREFLTILSVN